MLGHEPPARSLSFFAGALWGSTQLLVREGGLLDRDINHYPEINCGVWECHEDLSGNSGFFGGAGTFREGPGGGCARYFAGYYAPGSVLAQPSAPLVSRSIGAARLSA